jgi:hypothetical protein
MNNPNDINSLVIKTKCPSCQHKLMFSITTERCPYCGYTFDSEKIQQIFLRFRQKLLAIESKKQTGLAISDGMTSIGQGMSSIGCGLTILGIIIIGLILLL